MEDEDTADLEVMDRGLDQTIRTFQRDKGLKQDGLMNPGGETERALNRDLSGARKSIFVRPLSLGGPVGNNKPNAAADVKQVQRGLGGLGLVSDSKLFEPTGIIDRETVEGVKGFQRDNNLRVDGFLNPGGETERGVNSVLAKVQAAQKGGDEEEKEEEPKEQDQPKEEPKEEGENCDALYHEAEGAKAAIDMLKEKLDRLKKDVPEKRKRMNDAEAHAIQVAKDVGVKLIIQSFPTGNILHIVEEEGKNILTNEESPIQQAKDIFFAAYRSWQEAHRESGRLVSKIKETQNFIAQAEQQKTQKEKQYENCKEGKN